MTELRFDAWRDLEAAARRGLLSRRELVARGLALGVGLPVLARTIGACSRDDGTAASNSTGDQLESKLHVFNWSDYIAEDTIANFEKEFGVEVTYDTYESNEELEAKLLAGGAVYDVCVPAGYTVSRLIQADLLAPLDRAKLPNFANLETSFLDAPWDDGNRFTVPYQWGMTGIAYRSDKVEVPPQDLSVFFDARYQRKMTMMDDAREVLGAMLKKRGESQNSRDAAKLEVAKQDAVAAKRNLRAFLSAPVKAQLVAGEVWVAQLWNGDTAQAKAEQSAIDWVLPKEGSNLWSDSLVIPRAAEHKNAAHAFIDYVLRADVAAAISRFTGYGTPNRAAQEKLGDASIPVPAAADRARLEYQVDLGRDQALWDRLWTEVKLAE